MEYHKNFSAVTARDYSTTFGAVCKDCGYTFTHHSRLAILRQSIASAAQFAHATPATTAGNASLEACRGAISIRSEARRIGYAPEGALACKVNKSFELEAVSRTPRRLLPTPTLGCRITKQMWSS